ncbi:MAG TPA: hypothetical protein VFZ56_02125 [Gemmatimonadaceae bacterium]
MSRTVSHLWIAAAAFVVIGCADSPDPTAPLQDASLSRGVAQDRLAELFARTSPAVMAMGGTVFADHDEAAGKLVFGVENANAAGGVQRALEARGVSSNDYQVVVTEPIHNMVSLQGRWRPTRGGIQIHFSGYLCTMGFNVDHAGGRSFITNSHCTSRQGGTEGTLYYQPTSSVDGTVIATEAADPDYGSLPGCSAGKKCRYSDASRALYASGVSSDRGVIAKTSGANNRSLEVTGAFTVTAQNNNSTSFSGTVNKVGRTTGWSQGNVTNSCVTVNVSGSSVQLLCQTIVQKSGTVLVQGGDSGSPVFTLSGDNATLIGILWGGNSSGDLFVFSPLKNIQDELGGVTATADGSGGGTGGGGGGGDDPAPCVPKGPQGKNCK